MSDELSAERRRAVGRALATVMSSISEDEWCSGWEVGWEYTLWARVLRGDADDLKVLAEIGGCWVIFEEHGEDYRRAVPLDAWKEMYAAWAAKEGHNV